jgi:hypothetical protein
MGKIERSIGSPRVSCTSEQGPGRRDVPLSQKALAFLNKSGWGSKEVHYVTL